MARRRAQASEAKNISNISRAASVYCAKAVSRAARARQTGKSSSPCQ